MKKLIAYCLFSLFVFCSPSDDSELKTNARPASSTTISANLDTFIKAADVSFVPLIESEGVAYKKNGVAQDPLLTLKNAGCNTIRIRLWKNPVVNQSTFNEVKALATRAKNAGFKVWLSVHYSDTWADPGHQTTPLEWKNLSFRNLKKAAVDYTSTILTQINPDIIQIGNEINAGFLWPSGNLTTNESQCLQLISAISAKIRTQKPTTKIMLHYAGIGSGASWFFNKMKTINYDYIGLSYYPIWHGKSLTDLNNTITTLGQTYQKKVIIAETAYPFTLNWNDWTNNIIGESSQLISAYPATDIGQKNYLFDIKNIIKINTFGNGFCYWGGEWIAFRGTQSTNGSSWENQSLWDFNNNALPAMDAFMN
ncbi:MAG TPA: arabinogalactan endo-1,4-beta-galactosidase [Flavobacterium sp.]|nr:arabinogalactan endo-1,4-beta-galactosidase [Flavobacterium sp.]